MGKAKSRLKRSNEEKKEATTGWQKAETMGGEGNASFGRVELKRNLVNVWKVKKRKTHRPEKAKKGEGVSKKAGKCIF